MFADFNNNRNGDDFLDEFRQKLNTEPVENFEERKNEISRSKNVFIGTVSGIALAAVVGWFVLSPRYTNHQDAELPVIRRPQTAVKVQPADPGGMEILNQDKSVYDIIEKKDTSTPKVEKLLPAPEEPQLPVIATVEDIKTPAAEQAQKIIETAELKPQAETPKTNEPKIEEAKIEEAKIEEAKIEEAKIETPKEIKVAPQPQPAPEEPIAETPKTISPEQPTEKNKDINLPIPTKEEKPVNITAKVIVSKGPWQVQLLSSPNRKAIDSAWSGLVKKYPMLEGQPQEIETADLGSKGTFYRLKAGGFGERSGADRLCNDIKALGGTCIVKKK
ncbi:MAG: hypothetical protein E7012_03465 [Alphaproteobacteria bacterium]|nr:hypothetical protein [Alphaproteobacteria bacterium]